MTGCVTKKQFADSIVPAKNKLALDRLLFWAITAEKFRRRRLTGCVSISPTLQQHLISAVCGLEKKHGFDWLICPRGQKKACKNVFGLMFQELIFVSV
jgi:hypothetical protein